jgi:Rha family phage regulatory protein
MTNAIIPQIKPLEIKDGKPMADSRDVAARFEKQHAHVLRAIDNIVAQDPEALSNFGEGYYTLHSTGAQQHRLCTMDRDGFTLLAMGFTGAEAAKWKRAYIQAFNAMEAELRSQVAIAAPSSMLEAIELAAAGWRAEKTRADAEAAARAIADQRADALAVEVTVEKGKVGNAQIVLGMFLGKATSVNLTDVQKMCGMEQHVFMSEMRGQGFIGLRTDKIIAVRKYTIDHKWFECPYGTVLALPFGVVNICLHMIKSGKAIVSSRTDFLIELRRMLCTIKTEELSLEEFKDVVKTKARLDAMQAEIDQLRLI